MINIILVIRSYLCVPCFVIEGNQTLQMVLDILRHRVRVAMAEWLAHRTPNNTTMGSSPTKTSWLIKKHPVWATGDDNGASVHSAINENLAIDRTGNYLDYPWCLEACKRVYTPQRVEQVMDVTGLPRVIKCKALCSSFGKDQALYKNCLLYYISSTQKLCTETHFLLACCQKKKKHISSSVSVRSTL